MLTSITDHLTDLNTFYYTLVSLYTETLLNIP